MSHLEDLKVIQKKLKELDINSFSCETNKKTNNNNEYIFDIEEEIKYLNIISFSIFNNKIFFKDDGLYNEKYIKELEEDFFEYVKNLKSIYKNIMNTKVHNKKQMELSLKKLKKIFDHNETFFKKIAELLKKNSVRQKIYERVIINKIVQEIFITHGHIKSEISIFEENLNL